MKTRYLILALLIGIVGCKKVAVAAELVVVPAYAGTQGALPGFPPARE